MATIYWFFFGTRYEFAPVKVTVEAFTINDQHTIRQTLIWDNQANFKEGDIYEQSIFLDATNGTYLDPSGFFYPPIIPEFDFPEPIYSVESRIFDPVTQKRFGLIIYDPENLQKNVPQTIIWTTPITGTAETDMAGIDLHIGSSRCDNPLCVSFDTKCTPNPVDFEIDLPGVSNWPKPYPCFDTSWHIFLSNIMR